MKKEEKKVKDYDNLLELVIVAHIAGMKVLEPRVFLGGTTYEISGRRLTKKQIEELRTNTLFVNLLPEDSTPKEVVVSEKAGRDFKRAVETLVNARQSFYTRLNLDWKGPVFIWDQVKAVPFFSRRLPY